MGALYRLAYFTQGYVVARSTVSANILHDAQKTKKGSIKPVVGAPGP